MSSSDKTEQNKTKTENKNNIKVKKLLPGVEPGLWLRSTMFKPLNKVKFCYMEVDMH